MSSSSLKRFPAPTPLPDPTEALRALKIEFIPATAADIPFLRALYRACRLPELLMTPWSTDQKLAFLDDQFTLQHNHFLKLYRKGDFHLIRQTGRLVGRLSFDRNDRGWALIDILLTADGRSQGIGTAVIRWMQQSVIAAEAKQLRLSVAHNNPRARKLYDDLGFRETEATATHLGMVWTIPSTISDARLPYSTCP